MGIPRPADRGAAVKRGVSVLCGATSDRVRIEQGQYLAELACDTTCDLTGIAHAHRTYLAVRRRSL